MREIGERMSRRQWLKGASAVLAASLLPGCKSAPQKPAEPVFTGPRYKVAACDWTMLKRQTPGAITRAKEVGCDGVETDMGPLSKNPTFTNKFLSEPGFTESYLASCKENGIEISSLAMSGFYAQPFATREIEQPIKDCIATMKLVGVKTAFLPLGVPTDLTLHPELRPVVIERLKKVAPWAEQAGVVIGIETSLDAAGDKQLLDDIGSPAIRIYFNFQNGLREGRNLIEQIKILGKDRICQFHATNDDKFWLQDDPAIDMPKVKQTLDEMGWHGWLVIERSRRADRGRDVIGNFSANAKYLKSVFQG